MLKDVADSQPLKLAREFFLSDEKVKTWVASPQLQWPRIPVIRENPKANPGSSLYYAVRTGLHCLVKDRIESHRDGTQGAADRETPQATERETDGSASMTLHQYINDTGGTFGTPFLAASWKGDCDIVSLLLEHGANPDVYIRSQWNSSSALSMAAGMGHFAIVKLLLDKGADINDRPFQTSSSTGESTLVEGCVTTGSVEEELSKDNKKHKRDQSGKEVWIQPALDDTDWLASEQHLGTALCEAEIYGMMKAVNYILEKEALINLSQVCSGKTPLIAAVSRGRNDMVQILLNKEALIDGTDLQGRTPLWWACYGERANIARILLNHRANPNAPCMRQAHPMQRVGHRYTKRDEMIKLLLEFDADHLQFQDKEVKFLELQRRQEEKSLSSRERNKRQETFRSARTQTRDGFQLWSDSAIDVNGTKWITRERSASPRRHERYSRADTQTHEKITSRIHFSEGH